MTSETPSQPDIVRAKEIFNCRISSNWGSMEFGTMGLSSQFEDGHLLSDDMLIIEAVNKNNEAVQAGDKAEKLLITNLYNTTLPLIRYELTDQLTINERPAVCHSNLRAASWVEGRNEDHYIYHDGVTGKDIHVHAHLFRHVLEHCREIIEYQVIQTPKGADVVVITKTKTGVDTDNLQHTLACDLEKTGLTGARVTVRVVPIIERTSAQKLRRFIPITL
jgi:phenylacetate-coenzyme A ligase PaaK-like adenylate-forming protein